MPEEASVIEGKRWTPEGVLPYKVKLLGSYLRVKWEKYREDEVVWLERPHPEIKRHGSWEFAPWKELEGGTTRVILPAEFFQINEEEPPPMSNSMLAVFGVVVDYDRELLIEVPKPGDVFYAQGTDGGIIGRCIWPVRLPTRSGTVSEMLGECHDFFGLVYGTDDLGRFADARVLVDDRSEGVRAIIRSSHIQRAVGRQRHVAIGNDPQGKYDLVLTQGPNLYPGLRFDADLYKQALAPLVEDVEIPERMRPP